jgi:hypothetical protein
MSVTWVNQYNMIHFTLPKSPCVLLLDFEAIKQVINEKYQAKLQIKAKEASTASASAKGNPKKCSVLGCTDEQGPKKARPAKFCPYLTHNTNKCCKYIKDKQTCGGCCR